MRVMGPRRPRRPRAIDELQAASAVGQGKLYRVYDELLRARGVTQRQVLLTFFDVSARTHYLNARQTLRKLLEWRVVPVINENDTTATDEISFGDNDFLAAQVAILRRRRAAGDADQLRRASTPPTRASTRTRRAGRAVDDFARARRARDQPADLGARLGRDALEGRRRRDGDRRRDPDGDLQRPDAGDDRRGRPPASRSAPASPRARAATRASSCGSTTPSRRAARCSSTPARRGRCARAARACCRSASSRSAASSTPATRSRSCTAPTLVGKGICNYSAAELRQVRGLQSAEVRELLPRASDEAVHRDYFVLA